MRMESASRQNKSTMRNKKSISADNGIFLRFSPPLSYRHSYHTSFPWAERGGVWTPIEALWRSFRRTWQRIILLCSWCKRVSYNRRFAMDPRLPCRNASLAVFLFRFHNIEQHLSPKVVPSPTSLELHQREPLSPGGCQTRARTMNWRAYQSCEGANAYFAKKNLVGIDRFDSGEEDNPGERALRRVQE